MSATAPTTPTYRGLLVANSVFPRDPHNLPALEGPRNDPALLRAALSHDATGLFPEDNIRLVTERDMAEVLGEVEDFLSSARRDDMVLLYYSGHGTLDQTGEFYLCARDTRVDRLRSTAVKASDVSEMIAQSAARSTIVLLDCCHSGRFKAATAAAQDRLAGRGRFVITSSRGTELANDTDAVNRASLFTHHLVEGLRHGALDGDGDGIVDLSELYDYVHGALGTGGKPVPQKRFEGDGDVPIALRVPRLAIPDPPVVLAREPELDLSDHVIDLGTVVEGEPLPPERVSVVNRGGGTLEWTVESGSPWVRAVRSGNDILLEPAPTRGSSRANVHVRDLRTGAVRTLRIMVRVTAPAPPDPHPVPPPPVPPSPVPTAPVGSPAPAPAVGAGGVAPTAPPERSAVLTLAAAVGSLGLASMLAVYQVADWLSYNWVFDPQAMLGVALLVTAVLAVTVLRPSVALPALTLAATAGALVSAANVFAALAYAYSGLSEMTQETPLFVVAPFGLAAAAGAGIRLARRTPRQGEGRDQRLGIAILAAALALLSGYMLTLPVYGDGPGDWYYGEWYEGAGFAAGLFLALAYLALAAGLVVAARLGDDALAGAVLVSVLVPLALFVTDWGVLATDDTATPYSRLWIRGLPVGALAIVGVVRVRSRRRSQAPDRR